MARCKKGTRRNKKSGDCEIKTIKGVTRKYRKSGLERCKKGTRRSKKSGECEEHKKKIKISLSAIIGKDSTGEIKKREYVKDDTDIETFLDNIAKENKKKDKELFDSLVRRKNTTNRIISVLNSICTDSGECLIIGRENNLIKRMFNGFSDFDNLTNVKRVGEASSNGFVLNLQYEKMNYKVNALLKSSQKSSSDNLYYEYLVGTNFMNRMNNFVPCFTETYRLFIHESKRTKQRIEKYGLEEASDLKDVVKENPCDENNIKDTLKCIETSCSTGENFSILLQYVNNPISLESFIMNNEDDSSFVSQMIAIMFQVYCPLEYLSKELTHYDLHTGNVILYKLPKGKCIKFKYIEERSGNRRVTHEIESNYVAKIIDYGRCYFGNLGNDKYLNSKQIGKIIHNSKECSSHTSGFNFFGEFQSSNNYYMSSLMRNMSHDLRLAHMITKESEKMDNFFDNRIVYELQYGTKELNSDKTRNINNITDIMKFLEKTLEKSKRRYVSKNDVSIGTLEIYKTDKFCEKPMKFIEKK
jgi:hypothetical protein